MQPAPASRVGAVSGVDTRVLQGSVHDWSRPGGTIPVGLLFVVAAVLGRSSVVMSIGKALAARRLKVGESRESRNGLGRTENAPAFGSPCFRAGVGNGEGFQHVLAVQSLELAETAREEGAHSKADKVGG